MILLIVVIVQQRKSLKKETENFLNGCVSWSRPSFYDGLFLWVNKIAEMFTDCEKMYFPLCYWDIENPIAFKVSLCEQTNWCSFPSILGMQSICPCFITYFFTLAISSLVRSVCSKSKSYAANFSSNSSSVIAISSLVSSVSSKFYAAIFSSISSSVITFFSEWDWLKKTERLAAITNKNNIFFKLFIDNTP